MDKRFSPPVPHGYDEVVDAFGDIRPFIHSDGTLSPTWETLQIARVGLPASLPLAGSPETKVTRVTCHRLIATSLMFALRDIFELGLWPKLGAYGGGFNFRLKRGLSEVSLHAFGIAWDFDPDHNQLGTKGSMSPDIVKAFNRHGFFWGGDFAGRKDPMHFQFATGV